MGPLSWNRAAQRHPGAGAVLPDHAHIAVDQLTIDLIPAKTAAEIGTCEAGLATGSFVTAVKGKGVGKGFDRSGPDQPAAHAVADKALASGRLGRDHWQPDRHRFQC